jgi:AcrR family transcriptional regulator
MVRTRKPGAERREDIAKAVLKIVGERGLTALTTAAVAEEIGVTSGAIFRHVASRDEMLQETVRYAVERIEATFPDPSLPALDRLFGLARNRARLLGAEPGLAWLLLSEQASLALPAEAVERLRDLAQRSGRYLLGALREGAVEGTVRSDIEPGTLLVIVKGAIHALVPARGIHGGAANAADRVLAALRRLLTPPNDTRTRR